MERRGLRVALGAVAVATVVVAAAGVACRDALRARWWIARLDRGTREERLAAMQALGRLGRPETVRQLVEMLRRDLVTEYVPWESRDLVDYGVATDARSLVAAEALLRIGAPAIDRLLRALDDPDPVLRQNTADVLAKIGEDPEGRQSRAKFSEPFDALPTVGAADRHRIARALARLLEDPYWQVRRAAIHGLAWVSTPDDVAPALRKALGDPDAGVRCFAVGCLGDLEGAFDRDGERIAGMLRDPDRGVRTSTLWALRSAGSAAIRFLPDVLAAAGDPIPRVREGALDALAEIAPGDPGTEAALRAAHGDPDREVRAQAADLLRTLRLPAEPRASPDRPDPPRMPEIAPPPSG